MTLPRAMIGRDGKRKSMARDLRIGLRAVLGIPPSEVSVHRTASCPVLMVLIIVRDSKFYMSL